MQGRSRSTDSVAASVFLNELMIVHVSRASVHRDKIEACARVWRL